MPARVMLQHHLSVSDMNVHARMAGDFIGEHHRETISTPLPAFDGNGRPLSLMQALHHVLPEHIPDRTESEQLPPCLQVTWCLQVTCSSCYALILTLSLRCFAQAD